MPGRKGIDFDSRQVSFLAVTVSVTGLTIFLIVMLAGMMMDVRNRPAGVPGQKTGETGQVPRFYEYSSLTRTQEERGTAVPRTPVTQGVDGKSAGVLPTRSAAGFKTLSAPVSKKDVQKAMQPATLSGVTQGGAGATRGQHPGNTGEKSQVKEGVPRLKDIRSEKSPGHQKAKPGKIYAIQVGAFKSRQSVDAMKNNLRKLGFEYRLTPGELTKVTVIVRGSQKDAADAIKTLKDAGIHGVTARQQ